MKRLQEKGFWGGGLIPIRTPSMVLRYNRCLQDLGIPPTELTSFQIDGMGWSPQIAEEKCDPCYLSHGEANQFAILLSPDQEGKPVYSPAHSFDAELIAEVFRVARKQIANLTTETGLWLDIDQQIDHYHSPLDLLMLEVIKIKPTTIDRVIKAAIEQRQLVSQFREENDLWMDESARARLIESAKTYGDLRYKPVVITEIPFHNVSSFYSRAFGGVFLFRDLPGFLGDNTLMIVEDVRRHAELIERQSWIYGVKDVALYKTMIKRKLVAVDLELYREKPDLLENLKDNLLADTVYRFGESELNLKDATEGQKKQLVAKYSKRLPPTFFEIDILARQLRERRVKVSELSKELSRLLARPNREHPAHLQRVIWMALMKLHAHSVEHLYQYSKLQFYALYNQWPEQRRLWALSHLASLGLPNQQFDSR